MKKYILILTAFAALLITGCRKIETDGEKEIVIVNGGGGGLLPDKRSPCRDVSMQIQFCVSRTLIS